MRSATTTRRFGPLLLLLAAGTLPATGDEPWLAERLPAVPEVAVPGPAQPAGFVNEAIDANLNAEAAEFMTLDELKAEMKKLAWTKDEYKIVPYGHLSVDTIYQSHKTQPGPFTFFALSNQAVTPQGPAPLQLTPREAQQDAAFIVDARRSRLGVDVSGPTVPMLGGLNTGGKAEIDFFGSFNSTENRGGVLLRHIYGELKNDDWRLLAGQTWDLISPLLPGTLSYSVGWEGGNIGFRRAQVRAERYLHLSDDFLLTVAGSLNQDVPEDFTTDTATIRREPTDWPLVEGRVAATIGPRGEGCLPITVGISGHIGETQFDFLQPGPQPLLLAPESDARFRTWSFNVDVRAPVTPCFGFQGEFFTGANLSEFLGGIGQGVCPCMRLPIRDTGGWAEVWYDWTPRLHSHVGFGIDDPNDADSLLGRTYNRFIFANLSFDITKKFITGIEVASWYTGYHETRTVPPLAAKDVTPSQPGESLVIEWLVQYGF